MALNRCMKHCVGTHNRGRLIKPNATWDGSKDFEFVIDGKSDSDYAKDPITRCSVTGHTTRLCGVSIAEKCKMQNAVTLSVTESETASAVSCAQDMLFGMHVIESIGLKVQKPMLLWVDNKGAVDLANGWGVARRMHHISTKVNFLHELKEEGVLEVQWVPMAENPADIFTKNLPTAICNKHAAMFVGKDEYMEEKLE